MTGAGEADAEALLLSLALVDGPVAVALLGAVAQLADAEAVVDRLVADDVLLRERAVGGPALVAFVDEAARDRTLGAAAPALVRAAHRRWADATSGIDRWHHLVEGAEGVAPALAQQLEQEARLEAAQDELRAAQYLLWASALDPAAGERDRRLAEAVRLLVLGSREQEAAALAPQVEAMPPSPGRSEALGLLALVGMHVAEAREHLAAALEAAEAPELVERLRLELSYVLILLGLGDAAIEVSAAALSAASSAQEALVARLFLTIGIALRDGPSAGLAQLADLPEQPDHATAEQIPLLAQRGIWRGLTGRLDEAIFDLTVASRRRRGPFTRLMGATAHVNLIVALLFAGRWADADRTLAEARDVVAETGRRFDRAALYALSASLQSLRGDLAGAEAELAESAHLEREADFLGPLINIALARALLARMRGRPSDAVQALGVVHGVSDSDRARLFGLWWLPQLGDAYLATGDTASARRVIEQLRAVPSGGSLPAIVTAWLAGRLAELEDDREAAEAAYRQGARASLAGGDPMWPRAELLARYGEFLAASGRRRDALAQLTAAEALAGRMGAAPLRDRCAALIAGLRSESGPLAGLTGREREIATFAGRGWTNPEIAAELHLSARTIEHHLGNIYAKLHVGGRRELREVVREADAQRAAGAS